MNPSKLIRLLSALILVAVVGACAPKTETAQKQTVYDRVISSGTIRASYANYPPYCIKDANTGKLSGVFVDVLEEAGKRLELKVNWVEEVGWGAIFEGLNSDRHDIFGAGIWRNSTRGKVGDFSRPLFFNVIKVYGRAGDNRFKGKPLDAINSPDIRISAMDGAIEDIISKTDYPKAKQVSVPQLNPWSDVLLNITSGKADLTFGGPSAVNLYLEKNPGSVVELYPTPIRVFANTFALKLGEPKFKAMIDACLEEMLNDGTVEKILRRYEKFPGEYYRVAAPYDEPQSK